MLSQLRPNNDDSGYIKQTKQKARSAIKKVWQQEMREAPTKAELHLWEALSGCQLGVKFRRQAIVSGFLPDFWCGAFKIVVEVDGPIHEQKSEYDQWRDSILLTKGITILRFTNGAVLTHRDACVQVIRDAIAKRGVR